MNCFIKLFLLIFLSVTLLLGCVSAPSYTERKQDGMKVAGLDGQSGFVKFMTDLEQIKKPVFLIVSDNTSETISYLKRQRQANMYSALAYSDFDQDYLLESLKKTIEYFGINFADGSASMDKEGSRLPAIEVDVKIHLGALSFDTTSLDLTLICFDESGKVVGSIYRRGKGIIEWPAWTFSVKSSINSALQQVLAVLKEGSGRDLTKFSI